MAEYFRDEEGQVRVDLRFFDESQEVQADQTACPLVGSGIQNMNHPKNQALCLVDWTSRGMICH